MNPMLEFVDQDVEVVGSIVDGRKPVPHTIYWYRYPGEPRIYEIRFNHVGRSGYIYHSCNDPKVTRPERLVTDF